MMRSVLSRGGGPTVVRTGWSGKLRGGAAVASLLLAFAAAIPAEARAGEQDPALVKALEPGEVVPAFDVEAIDGTRRHIDFPKGSTTVLLFFLSSCSTCHRMIPEWNRAYASKPANLTVVGVMLDREPRGFFEARPISFPVVRALSSDFGRSFKIQRVPVTLRVTAGGKIDGVEVGPVDPIRLGELFRR